jgi:hypothetical protein
MLRRRGRFPCREGEMGVVRRRIFDFSKLISNLKINALQNDISARGFFQEIRLGVH